MFTLAVALLAMPAAAQEPEEVYARFHRALFDGNEAEMARYGTAEGAAEMARMPPEARKGAMELMRKLLPRSYAIASREVAPDGNSAVLQATGTMTDPFTNQPGTQYGTIRMRKVGGAWKVAESSWNNQPPRGLKPAPGPSPAARTAPAPAPAPRPATAPSRPATAPSRPPARPAAASACVYKPVMTDEDIARCR
jgi:hypothetical protein